MSRRLIPVLSLFAAVILFVMLNFTTPAEIGPLGVLVFFVAIYLLVYGIAFVLVKMFTRLTGNRVGSRTYLYAAILAFGPLMLLLAQSLGNVSIVTVGLVVIFVVLACFLVGKRAK